MTETFKILKINGDTREIADDIIVKEAPLTINIADKELVTVLCMPSSLDDFITGFLFTSGLIKKIQDIKKVVVNEEQWVAYVDLISADTKLVFKRLYTSGCGRGAMFYNAADIINRAKIVSDFKIEPARISLLVADFQKKSEIYLKTGGVHSAALADKGGVLIFREDIGRHNAVDKVIGSLLRRRGSFKNKILISSGRISSEVLFKAQKAGIPILVSQSAPTNQAVRLARDMDITLVGFARGARMNIYSFEERIL